MFCPIQQTKVNPAINNLTVHDAVELFTKTQIALAEIESNGIRIDVQKLDANIKEAYAVADEAAKKCLADPVGQRWLQLYPTPNLQNRNELADVLFSSKGLGFECVEKTKTGKPKVDKETLERMPQISDFTYHYLTYQSLLKAISTNMTGLYKVLDPNNFIHPSFTLLGVSTYRSAATSPNVQNIPNRNPRIQQLIRSLYVPNSPTARFVEVDYDGSEVRCNASINGDPTLVKSITEGLDFHKWVAAEVYLMSQDDVTKQLRTSVKGKYTFAAFYGAFWKNIAKALWDNIAYDDSLKTKQGIPLKEWIASKGIIGLGDPDKCAPGSYYAHIQNVDKRFWAELFPVYAQWKKDLFKLYLKTGYVDEPTGFRCAEIMERNLTSNAPAQGCLGAGSKVLTSEGWRNIETLIGVPMTVWTGFRWANAVGVDMGKCQLAEIELENGQIIKCDTRHKLKGVDDKWIDFDDLRKGTCIALPKIDRTRLQPSKEMNWWFFAGFCVGDGCLRVLKNGTATLSVSVGDKKAAIVRQMFDFLLAEGVPAARRKNEKHIDCIVNRANTGVYWRQSKREKTLKGKDRQDCYGFRTINSTVTAKLQSIGLIFGTNAHTKRLPEQVWTATPQQQCDFLAGYLAADGSQICVDRRMNKEYVPIRVHTPNKGLLQDLQILVSGLGLRSAIIISKTGYQWDAGGWDMWQKRRELMFPVARIKQFLSKIDGSVYREDESILAQSHRNALKREYVSHCVAVDILERHGVSFDEYRYCQIKEIRILDDTATTYTMSVDDDLHQFVADGVITKNSSFHLLARAMTELHFEMKSLGMRSQITGEIHDSMIASVEDDELETYCKLARKWMTQEVPRYNKWLRVPLACNFAVSPVGGSWAECKEFDI